MNSPTKILEIRNSQTTKLFGEAHFRPRHQTMTTFGHDAMKTLEGRNAGLMSVIVSLSTCSDSKIEKLQ